MVFGIGRKNDISETFHSIEDTGSGDDSILEFHQQSKGSSRKSPYERDDGASPTRRSRVLRVKEGEENRRRSKSAGRKIADGARSVVGLFGGSMTSKSAENSTRQPVDAPESHHDDEDDDEEALVKWVEETKSPKKKTLVPKIFRSSKNTDDDAISVDTHIQFAPEDLIAAESCLRKVSLSTTASDRSSQDGLQNSAGSLYIENADPASPSRSPRKKATHSSSSSPRKSSSSSSSPRKKSSSRSSVRSSRDSRSVSTEAEKAIRRSLHQETNKKGGKDLETLLSLTQIVEDSDTEDNNTRSGTRSSIKSPRRSSQTKRRSNDRSTMDEASPTDVKEDLSNSNSNLREKSKSSKSDVSRSPSKPPKSPTSRRRYISDEPSTKESDLDDAHDDDDGCVEVFSASNSPRRKGHSSENEEPEGTRSPPKRSKSGTSKSPSKSPTKTSRGTRTERGSRTVCPASPSEEKDGKSRLRLEELSGKKSTRSSATVSSEHPRRSRDSKSVSAAPSSRSPRSPNGDDNSKRLSRSSPRKSRDSKSVAQTLPKVPVIDECSESSPTKTQQSRSLSPSKTSSRGRSSRTDDPPIISPSRQKRPAGSSSRNENNTISDNANGSLLSPAKTDRRSRSKSRSRHERKSTRSSDQDDQNRHEKPHSERSHHERSLSKVGDKSRRSERSLVEKSRRSDRTIEEKSRRSERTTGEKSRRSERTTGEKSRRSERTTGEKDGGSERNLIKPILRDSMSRDDSLTPSSATKDRGLLSPNDCDRSFSRVMKMLDEMTPGTPLDVTNSPSKIRSSQDSERLLRNIEKSPPKSSKTRKSAIELLRKEVAEESRSRSKSRSRRSGSRSPSRHRHRSRSRGAPSTRRTKREDD